MAKSLVSEILKDIASPKIVPALSAGTAASVVLVIAQTSYAAMIFSGSLSPLAARAAGLTIFGSFLLCIVGALGSSLKSTITVTQDAPAAVLSAIAVAIAAALGDKASPETRFMTVTAALALSTVLTGVSFLLIGRFRLANLFRFMPHPVLGGFLAGTGWVLVAGGLKVMCGAPLSFATLSRLASPDMLLRWLPGAVYGAVLFAITRKRSNFFILPASSVIATALFYLVLNLGGVTVETAKTSGYLLSGVPAGGLWPTFTMKELASIDWPTIMDQLPGIFSVALVTTVGMLLNMSGIELAAGKELDMNRELAVCGTGNCVAGLAGSSPGYPSIVLSLLNLKTGANSRLTGLVVASIVGVVLLASGKFLEYFPKGLLGGMLMLLGFSLVNEWIVKSRKQLPWPDYLIVFVIFLIIGLQGFMEGVACGLVAAVVLFVVRISRAPTAEGEFTGVDRRSLRARPIPHRKILMTEGERIRCYPLTGYIFFGSASSLVESLKSALASTRRADFIILDFARVSGFDISAVNNFRRFTLNAGAAGTALAFTAAPERFKKAIEGSLPEKNGLEIQFLPDLDRGLEWCEDRLIASVLARSQAEPSVREAIFHQSADDLMAHLESQERFELLVESLSPWLEKREHSAGKPLVNKGEAMGGLHLLTRGTATELDPDACVRTRGLTAGSVIGAQAAFCSHTAPAAVTADSDCATAYLSFEARILLERENPDLALSLHAFLIQTLGR